MTSALAVLLLMFSAQIQFPQPNFPQQGPQPPPWLRQPAPARVQRQIREQCVRRLGEEVRDIVESCPEAAFALLACSPEMARYLARSYSRGDFNNVPQFPALLETVSRPDHGDDVACFIILHRSHLEHPGACRAFLAAPLEISLGLKSLPAPVEEELQPWQAALTVAIPVGVLVMFYLLYVRKPRQRAQQERQMPPSPQGICRQPNYSQRPPDPARRIPVVLPRHPDDPRFPGRKARPKGEGPPMKDPPVGEPPDGAETPDAEPLVFDTPQEGEDDP